MNQLRSSPSLGIAGFYLLIGSAWILLTDRILTDHQTLKGLGFVLISSLLIAALIHRAWQTRTETEKRFQAVIENAWDIISIIDRDGTRKYHSPAFERVLGYRSEDVVGESVFDHIHPEDRPAAEQMFGELLSQPGASASTEVRVFHADGSLRHLVVTATNLLEEPAVAGIVLNTRDITDRKMAELQIRRQLEHLAGLQAIDRAILESPDLDHSLAVVLEQVTTQLGVDAASILLFDAERQELTYAAGRGFRGTGIRGCRIPLGEGYAGRALSEGATQILRHMDGTQHVVAGSEFIAGEDFVAYVALPLFANGQPKGVLDVFNRAPLDPDDEWFGFATAIAAQAAIAVDNAQLFGDLQQTNTDLALAYDRTLEGWARALELRDDETVGHSRRVVDLTQQVARELGISGDELLHIRRGALLHDIGKIAVPDAILLKPGPLDEDEWAVMRRHPDYARQLLQPIPFLHPALAIPYSHHERWDGSGYPQGLEGDAIPLAARIFAVTDVYDALTSDRPYRAAWSHEAAVSYITGQAGTLFDPEVCAAFLAVLQRGEPATLAATGVHGPGRGPVCSLD